MVIFGFFYDSKTPNFVPGTAQSTWPRAPRKAAGADIVNGFLHGLFWKENEALIAALTMNMGVN